MLVRTGEDFVTDMFSCSTNRKCIVSSMQFTMYQYWNPGQVSQHVSIQFRGEVACRISCRFADILFQVLFQTRTPSSLSILLEVCALDPRLVLGAYPFIESSMFRVTSFAFRVKASLTGRMWTTFAISATTHSSSCRRTTKYMVRLCIVR